MRNRSESVCSEKEQKGRRESLGAVKEGAGER